VRAGHSWALGIYSDPNGKGQESTSEAVNAWYGIYLYAQVPPPSAPLTPPNPRLATAHPLVYKDLFRCMRHIDNIIRCWVLPKAPARKVIRRTDLFLYVFFNAQDVISLLTDTNTQQRPTHAALMLAHHPRGWQCARSPHSRGSPPPVSPGDGPAAGGAGRGDAPPHGGPQHQLLLPRAAARPLAGVVVPRVVVACVRAPLCVRVRLGGACAVTICGFLPPCVPLCPGGCRCFRRLLDGCLCCRCVLFFPGALPFWLSFGCARSGPRPPARPHPDRHLPQGARATRPPLPRLWAPVL